MAHVAVHGFRPKRAGPKPAIKSPEQEEEIAEAIKEFIAQDVSVNQDVIRDWCEERFGISLSQSSWSRFIKRHDIPHKAGSKFWPKSKLVQTKDRPTKGFKRKKKGETEGVEGGEGGETGGLDDEQRSEEGLSRLHEEESQSPAQYEQPTTTHQRQTPTFAHSPPLGTCADQHIASMSQPQHTSHGHNVTSD